MFWLVIRFDLLFFLYVSLVYVRTTVTFSRVEYGKNIFVVCYSVNKWNCIISAQKKISLSKRIKSKLFWTQNWMWFVNLQDGKVWLFCIFFTPRKYTPINIVSSALFKRKNNRNGSSVCAQSWRQAKCTYWRKRQWRGWRGQRCIIE